MEAMGFIGQARRWSAGLALMVLLDAMAAGVRADDLSWGRPIGGLQAALVTEGRATVGGPVRFRVALTTVGSPPARLGPVDDVFGWFLIVQKAGDDSVGYYSERVHLKEPRRTQSPDGSTGEVIHFEPIDLAGAKAYSSEHARALLTAYLKGEGGPMPEPAGTWGKLLAPGKAVAKFTLCLPQASGRPLVVPTDALAVDVAAPDLGKMSVEERDAYLLKQFDRDAFSAKRAHDEAVRLGPPILPTLIAAVAKRDRPDHSRLWMAAALADIREPRAVRALVDLLDDPSRGVRNVVAYHGPKQRDASLDAAIIERVKRDTDPGLVAWALLGFLVFRGEVPEAVMKAGLESDDPRARATVARALAGHRTHETVARLAALLEDEDERVRGVAATVLARMDARGPNVLGALVGALDRPGESAREKITQALSELTGKPWIYDPRGAPAARRETIEAWKSWWAERLEGRQAPAPRSARSR